jgi:putative hydrolase of the HAD superfamily
MIKGLIFDFDGLILDTETPEYQALNETYADYGQHLPIETYGAVVGSQYNETFEPVAHLSRLTSQPIAAEEFWERVNRRRFEIIDHSQPLPGVETYLREAKTCGLKLAIASSSPHRWVEKHLQRLGLLHYFDTIQCQEDVRQIKPDPELFLAALNALQLQAEEALIFEDSVNGVIAAQRAGIRVVAVPNPVTVNLNLNGASLRLKSLADLPLAALLTHFSTNHAPLI